MKIRAIVPCITALILLQCSGAAMNSTVSCGDRSWIVVGILCPGGLCRGLTPEVGIVPLETRLRVGEFGILQAVAINDPSGAASACEVAGITATSSDPTVVAIVMANRVSAVSAGTAMISAVVALPDRLVRAQLAYCADPAHCIPAPILVRVLP